MKGGRGVWILLFSEVTLSEFCRQLQVNFLTAFFRRHGAMFQLTDVSGISMTGLCCRERTCLQRDS